jgi:hypothetical protein
MMVGVSKQLAFNTFIRLKWLQNKAVEMIKGKFCL